MLYQQLYLHLKSMRGEKECILCKTEQNIFSLMFQILCMRTKCGLLLVHLYIFHVGACLALLVWSCVWGMHVLWEDSTGSLLWNIPGVCMVSIRLTRALPNIVRYLLRCSTQTASFPVFTACKLHAALRQHSYFLDFPRRPCAPLKSTLSLPLIPMWLGTQQGLTFCLWVV